MTFMKCPNCGVTGPSVVKATREVNGMIGRSRECSTCSTNYQACEKPDSDLHIYAEAHRWKPRKKASVKVTPEYKFEGLGTSLCEVAHAH